MWQTIVNSIISSRYIFNKDNFIHCTISIFIITTFIDIIF